MTFRLSPLLSNLYFMPRGCFSHVYVVGGKLALRFSKKGNKIVTLLSEMQKIYYLDSLIKKLTSYMFIYLEITKTMILNENWERILLKYTNSIHPKVAYPIK